MKHIVVAIDKNRGIGAENDLLWQRDLPADLAHFKQLTIGQTVIMGRRTFESIGRALPERQNIVVSQSDTETDDIEIASSLPAAYALARHAIYVIGGGQIYHTAINDVDRLHVTEVDAEFPQATVFFPAIDADKWQEISREHHDPDSKNSYPFDFVVYDRQTKNPS